MNLRFYWLIVVLAIFIGIATPESTLGMNLEELSISVAYLREEDKIGTGFFVASPQPYLVTTAHVAVFLSPQSTLTIRAHGDKPVTFKLDEFSPGKVKLPWHFHPEADVAVLALTITDKALPIFKGRFLTLNMIESEEVAPRRERPLVVMGFPLALGTIGRFSPITSEGKTASGLLRIHRFDNKKEATFFILDKPSIGGFSGAPVYLIPGPYSEGAVMVMPNISAPAKCVGLVHGTISDDTGGKLAAVVPAAFIVQTIKEVEGKVSSQK